MAGGPGGMNLLFLLDCYRFRVFVLCFKRVGGNMSVRLVCYALRVRYPLILVVGWNPANERSFEAI